MLSATSFLGEQKPALPPAPVKKPLALAKPKSAASAKPGVEENKLLPNKTGKEAMEERSKIASKALGDLNHLIDKGGAKKSPPKPTAWQPAHHAKPLDGKAAVTIKGPTGPGSLDAAIAGTGTKKLSIEVDGKKVDTGYLIKTDQIKNAPKVLLDRFKGLEKIEKGDKTYFVKKEYAAHYKK